MHQEYGKIMKDEFNRIQLLCLKLVGLHRHSSDAEARSEDPEEEVPQSGLEL